VTQAEQPQEQVKCWGPSFLGELFAAWDIQPGAIPACVTAGTFPSSWLSFRNDSVQGKVRRKEEKKSEAGMAVMGNTTPESSGLQRPRGKWWKPHRLLHPQLAGLTPPRPGLAPMGGLQPREFPVPVSAVPLCPARPRGCACGSSPAASSHVPWDARTQPTAAASGKGMQELPGRVGKRWAPHPGTIPKGFLKTPLEIRAIAFSLGPMRFPRMREGLGADTAAAQPSLHSKGLNLAVRASWAGNDQACCRRDPFTHGWGQGRGQVGLLLAPLKKKQVGNTRFPAKAAQPDASIQLICWGEKSPTEGP